LAHHAHSHATRCALRCAVLTVSDTRSLADDRSGACIRDRLEGAGHGIATHRVVPDERELIAAQIRSFVEDPEIDAVIVTGGTGLALRDVTYEAVSAMLQKRMDGFGELFRMLSFEQVGSAAMLSRAVAGLVETTVVFALPGSPAACELALDKLILPELSHVVSLVNPKVGEH
jgi:molybdenum cofactor biosynthesis protein B